MIHTFFALILSISVFASPREEAADLLSKYQQLEQIDVRMDAFSKGFLGLPYGVGGPLGEGKIGRFDQDPLYRFDTFDCTTFVETMVSLALSTDALTFERKMDEIRYENAHVDYFTRNHDPSLNWIPNNLKNGYFKELNSLILPASERRMAEAEINLPGWLKSIKLEEIHVPEASDAERQNLLEELHGYASQYQPVISRLEYLPINTLLIRAQVLKKIPNGTVVSFVRPNWDLTDSVGTHMNVSHQGLIFQRKEGPILRHASSSSEKRVMEVPLYEYLKKFENHPTLKGIHLLGVAQTL